MCKIAFYVILLKIQNLIGFDIMLETVVSWQHTKNVYFSLAQHPGLHHIVIFGGN